MVWYKDSEKWKSCPTLCDPMDCNLPGSSVQGILQARRLDWVAISFSRGSSQPRDQTQVSFITGKFFTIWATGKPNTQLKSSFSSTQLCPVVPASFVEKMYVSLLNYIDAFVENQVDHKCVSSLLTLLQFHWSVCLSFCRCHTGLITVAFLFWY